MRASWDAVATALVTERGDALSGTPAGIAYGVGAVVVLTAESATAPSHVIAPVAILSVG